MLSRFRQKMACNLRAGQDTCVSILFEFRPPPYGGGNQFLHALRNGIKQKGLDVLENEVSSKTRACLFNSHHFDPSLLEEAKRQGAHLVHRVDGPLQTYRGSNDGTDDRIMAANWTFADTTVLQSRYSLLQHQKLGMELRNPVVIPNAVNPEVFFPLKGRHRHSRGKIKLISTSWSNNPNKGAGIYKWIEEHLDWDRFSYTFVGSSSIAFDRIHMIPPLPSHELAEVLREHDIYITASRHDPCSNALLEALACGLPSLYLRSGGHAELVGEGGIGFTGEADVLSALERLVAEYDVRRDSIDIAPLSEVTELYLSAMGVDMTHRARSFR